MSSPDTSTALDRILRDLDSAISFGRQSFSEKKRFKAMDNERQDDDDDDEMTENIAEADRENLLTEDDALETANEEIMTTTVTPVLQAVIHDEEEEEEEKIIPLEPALEIETMDVVEAGPPLPPSPLPPSPLPPSPLPPSPLPSPPTISPLSVQTFQEPETILSSPPPTTTLAMDQLEEPIVNEPEPKIMTLAEDEEHGRQVDRLLADGQSTPAALSVNNNEIMTSVTCGRPLLALRLIPNHEARLEIGKSRLQTLLPVPAVMNEPGRERDLRLDRRIVQEKPPIEQLIDLMPSLQADFAQTIDLDPAKEAIRTGWTAPKFHRPLVLAKSGLLRPFVGDFPWPIRSGSLLVALPYGWQSTCPSLGYTLKRLQLPVTVREVVEWIREYYAKRLGLCMGNTRWYGFTALFKRQPQDNNKGLLILVPDVEAPAS